MWKVSVGSIKIHNPEYFWIFEHFVHGKFVWSLAFWNFKQWNIYIYCKSATLRFQFDRLETVEIAMGINFDVFGGVWCIFTPSI